MATRYLQVPLARDVLVEFEKARRTSGQSERSAVLEALALYAAKRGAGALGAAVANVVKRVPAEARARRRDEERALGEASDIGALDNVVVPDGTPGAVSYSADPQYASYCEQLGHGDRGRGHE